MRNYSKVGGKIGKPGYRTASMFRNKVLNVVAKIPKGKTLTYKQVATLAGNPKAARAVGNIMHGNCNPKVPCHRVIRADGRVGGYNNGGESRKRAILKQEGALK